MLCIRTLTPCQVCAPPCSSSSFKLHILSPAGHYFPLLPLWLFSMLIFSSTSLKLSMNSSELKMYSQKPNSPELNAYCALPPEKKKSLSFLSDNQLSPKLIYTLFFLSKFQQNVAVHVKLLTYLLLMLSKQMICRLES